MPQKPVIICFPGFCSSCWAWRNTCEPSGARVRKIGFLNKLAKIGRLHLVEYPWFAIDRYGLPPDPAAARNWAKIYREDPPFVGPIDFVLRDLDYDQIAASTHAAVVAKFGAGAPLVVAGHSYGGPIAYYFAAKYRVKCCLMLDSASLDPAMQKELVRRFDSKPAQIAYSKQITDELLAAELQRVQAGSQAAIRRILDLVSRRSGEFKLRNPARPPRQPCLFFRAIHPHGVKHGAMWNRWTEAETAMFPGCDKVQRYYYLGADHFLFKDEAIADDICLHLRVCLEANGGLDLKTESGMH